MTSILNPHNPVVIFIPEAGIYPFLRGLAVLGDAISKHGGKVFITRDSGTMFRSPLMAKVRMPADASLKEREKICRVNTRRLKDAQRKYGFSIIELSDMATLEEILEINRLVDASGEDLENVVFRGFPVGKIAQYDFILETKFPYSKDLSAERKVIYSAYVKNTALSLVMADAIYQRYKPSLFLTFNEYAQCQAVRHSAHVHGVRRMAMTYPVNFNVDGSRFSIWETTCEYWRYRHCSRWNEGKDLPAPAEVVTECWNDTLFRMFGTGSHIFSSQKKGDPSEIFTKLRLSPRRKTIVVYTSSQDERTSVEVAMKIWKEDNHIVDAFSSHIEWLSMLRDFASKRDDVQIVVRIHPREGLRQFGTASRHLEELKKVFTENSENFIMIWPDEPISSYDLMELADVCLVAWSLMGQEAARLGIPVLSFTGNMFYPDDDFMQVGATRESYTHKLDALLEMKYTWNHLLKAVRFYHWRIFLPSLDLKETVPADFKDDTYWPEAPSSMTGAITDILSGKQDLISYNMDKWRTSITPDSANQESLAMKKGIRMFLDTLFSPPGLVVQKGQNLPVRIFQKIMRLAGKKPPANKPATAPFVDYRLEFVPDISEVDNLVKKSANDTGIRFIVSDGPYAVLVHNGKLIRRMSPLAIRLARLHDESR